jgi:meiotically up-regulated gene 157 (Mug157) protein
MDETDENQTEVSEVNFGYYSRHFYKWTSPLFCNLIIFLF